MKELSPAMTLVFGTLIFVFCLTSSAKAQGSQMPSPPITSSVKSRNTVAIKITADSSTNMCGDGNFLIIDNPFTNNRKNIVFGGVYTWDEDETAVAQSSSLNGFTYLLTTNNDCPVKKWLMYSVQSGLTYAFTATRLR